MKTVITYGSYDMLHEGHVNLLRRARELGDRLIVGVTSESFDIGRGKINVQQSLSERMQAVMDTGYPDLVIPEEYVGQKIDDIQRYDVDIFAIGSDWEGYFSYLEEYCDVVYLPRTEGISSTQIRETELKLRLGIIGDSSEIEKYVQESHYVSGVEVVAQFPDRENGIATHPLEGVPVVGEDELYASCEAVYVANKPERRFAFAKKALLDGKHVMVESPVAFHEEEARELFEIAESRGLIMMEGLKTAYALAFSRLTTLLKSNRIGKIRSISSRCTSLAKPNRREGSLYGWGPLAALPIFTLLGSDYKKASAATVLDEDGNDSFTQVNFTYEGAVATLTVGNGAKSEGDLVVTGTKGYLYVPAPWWKTEYYELRFEDPADNQRFFYQLPGEGIRFEISSFSKAVSKGRAIARNVPENVSVAIAKLMEDFNDRKMDVEEL